MQVAQRGQRSIERIEVPRHLAAQDRDAHYQHDGPHARQLGEPVNAHGRNSHGDQHEEGLGGKLIAGHALGINKRRPARGSAQNLWQVKPARGHASGFDEFRKRRGITPKHDERADPPRRYRQAAQEPGRAGFKGAAVEQDYSGRSTRRDGRGGIDRTHQCYGDGGRGGIAPGELGVEEGQDNPGGQHDRPGLRRNGGQSRKRARRERVEHRRYPDPPSAQAYLAGELMEADEADA